MRTNGLAVTFPKGGTGKTFTALNVAGGLNAHGANVLLVDLDPQGSLTANLGYSSLYKDGERLSLDEILLNVGEYDRIPELILSEEEFDFIPANMSFHGNGTPLDSAQASEKRLSKIFEKLEEEHPKLMNYHYVVLDCPPDLKAYQKNALMASDDLIVPVAPNSEAAHSTAQLAKVKEQTEMLQDVSLNLLAFILTLDHQGGLSSEEQRTKDWFWENYGEIGFEIKELAAFNRAKEAHKSIFQHSESLKKPEVEVYHDLIRHIIENSSPPERDNNGQEDLLETTFEEIKQQQV